MIRLSKLTERMNPRNIEVRPIEGNEESELFDIMVKKHYLQGANKNINIHFGIFADGNMIGIAAYGPPTFPLIAKQLHLSSNEVYELRRFYTEENNIHNLESQALTLANEEIKQLKPILKVIVTYADPTQGHFGTLYQATNAKFLGKGKGAGGKYKYIFLLGSKSEKKNTEKRMGIEYQDYPKKELNEFTAEGFDLDEFLNIRSFAGQVRYANSKLTRIAQGSARIIFEIDDKTVLKLAKNEKGIAQNEVEESLSNDYMVPEDIIAKVLEADEKDRWLVMERAKKIGKVRFRQLMDGIDIEDFYDYIRMHTDNRPGIRREMDPGIEEKLNENEFAQDLIEMIHNFDIEIGDFGRISSFGEIDGRLVITDYGLTKEVFKKHYDVYRKQHRNNW